VPQTPPAPSLQRRATRSAGSAPSPPPLSHHGRGLHLPPHIACGLFDAWADAGLDALTVVAASASASAPTFTTLRACHAARPHAYFIVRALPPSSRAALPFRSIPRWRAHLLHTLQPLHLRVFAPAAHTLQHRQRHCGHRRRLLRCRSGAQVPSSLPTRDRARNRNRDKAGVLLFVSSTFALSTLPDCAATQAHRPVRGHRALNSVVTPFDAAALATIARWPPSI